MDVRIVFSAEEVQRMLGGLDRAIGPSAQQVLRALAIQAETAAMDLASGSFKKGGAGSYPIPVRTGHFRRSFGIDVQKNRSTAFNDALYARALHDGYKPYGNPHATPIQARPYFDDALKRLDLQKVYTDWQRSLGA